MERIIVEQLRDRLYYATDTIFTNNRATNSKRNATKKIVLQAKHRSELFQNSINLTSADYHQVVSPAFGKVYDGFSVVQDGISNGFLHVRKSWFDAEIQAMANCHCERFFVHEKTDGHIHVNLIFLLVFHSFSLKLRQSGIEEIRNILVLRNKPFDFILNLVDAVTNIREVCTV